jgi:hypothetical protein
MTLENAVRIMAGSMVLLSLALTRWVSPYFVWLTVFVGVNLIQSALTGFCPAEMLLRKFGVGQGGCCPPAKT